MFKVTGEDGTATLAIRLLSSILSIAVDMGIIGSNPALGVKLAPSGQHHLSHEELRRLGTVLDETTKWQAAATAATVIRLLVLTGARRGEIEGLNWSEVDFQFGMLRKETSKTGAKVIPRARGASDPGRPEAVGLRQPGLGFPRSTRGGAFRQPQQGMEPVTDCCRDFRCEAA